MSGMPCRARVATWNRKDVLLKLRDLSWGRDIVEAVEQEAPARLPEEEAGIEVALKSLAGARLLMRSAPPRS